VPENRADRLEAVVHQQGEGFGFRSADSQGLHSALKINPGIAALYSECTDEATTMESILDVLAAIQLNLAVETLVDAITST
jgi:hypothetical protein